MFNIAMIGLGSIAQKAYLPVVCNHPQVTPVFCTRNRETLALLSSKYRVSRCFTTLDELLKSPPDAAMVHSSTESHPAIVETLLEAGIPVFVDKPISYQLPESEALAELAERKNLPLFVGFNRRYAPLISGIDEPRPVHVQLQKNRPNQPNDARTFVLDDFIHVIDTLRFLSNTQRLPDIDIQVHWRNSDLAAVQVQWRNGDTLVTGAMNRICGVAEEQLQLFGQLRKWTVNNLRHGWLNENGKKPLALGFNDWEPTLVKRGFHAMFQAFLERVEQGGCNTEELKDALQTHRLCEKILTGISA